jgi:hypothetical protein
MMAQDFDFIVARCRWRAELESSFAISAAGSIDKTLLISSDKFSPDHNTAFIFLFNCKILNLSSFSPAHNSCMA